MEYRELKYAEITRELFVRFERHQTVTHCWRKINGSWQIQNIPFIDQWSEDEYCELVECLKNTLSTGGVVYGAFASEILKGFSSVESKTFGENFEYLDLSSIHVSEDMRGKGIGKELFRLTAGWARANGGKKLYISAHSSVESQAFYKAMACTEAKEYNTEHVEKEPCDCQLEFCL